MARRDALLRLQETLAARRDELHQRLSGDLKGLLHRTAASGDSADMAFDSGAEEVSSQLAELESRELHQIEKAIHRLKQGTYGVCEGCQKKIPVARLNALPFTTTCIGCQREIELYGGFDRGARPADWERVERHLPREDQKEVNLAELEMNL